MIQLKYFGSIAEKTMSNEETFVFSNHTLTQILEAINGKYNIKNLSYSIAVNQKIVKDVTNFEITDNDVIALLPPFAGG
jgi:sulfur-carrier protein